MRTYFCLAALLLAGCCSVHPELTQMQADVAKTLPKGSSEASVIQFCQAHHLHYEKDTATTAQAFKKANCQDIREPVIHLDVQYDADGDISNIQVTAFGMFQFSSNSPLQVILRNINFASDVFVNCLTAEFAHRIGELPLADYCEQGGTPANASVNVSDIDYGKQTIRALIEVIFVERFPLGCGNSLQEKTRRARFEIEVDRETNSCRFIEMDDDTEPDL